MLRFVDLFAGIGGLRIAFESIGGECVFSSEIDKFAQQTYQENFKEKPFGDITQIDSKDIPDHEMLLAGFPCQAFSNAGFKKGFNDKRGLLFFEIERILRDKKPKLFLLENVKALKNHDKGKTFSTILKTLKDLNYTVHYKILNAYDFATPQNRQRIFLVGLNNDYKFKKEFEFPNPIMDKKYPISILEKNIDVNSKYTLSDIAWNSLKKQAEVLVCT